MAAMTSSSQSLWLKAQTEQGFSSQYGGAKEGAPLVLIEPVRFAKNTGPGRPGIRGAPADLPAWAGNLSAWQPPPRREQRQGQDLQ
jgi:hypothetical protein